MSVVAALRAADVQRAQPALVVGGDRHGVEHPLDLVVGEAVRQQPLARGGLHELLRARAGGHALGGDADEPARARRARHGDAVQRVDLLRLDAAHGRRLVLRVARGDRDLGAPRALAVAHPLGDVLGQRLGPERALAEDDLADRVVDDLLEARHVRALLARPEVDEALQPGREQLLGPAGRMRMTFSTSVTPTRESETCSVGTWFCTSWSETARIGRRRYAGRARMADPLAGSVHPSANAGQISCYKSRRTMSVQGRLRRGGRSGRQQGSRALSTKTEVLLADEAPIAEIDELRQLIAEGQERGFLTFDQIASSLEEVEVTKEQVPELHAHLDEQGIDVVGADGRPAVGERRVASSAPRRGEKAADAPRKSRRSTSRSSRRSTRCACTCARSAAWRC